MTFDVLDELPAADPLVSENAMLTSLIDSLLSAEAQIASLQARQTMLLVAAVEVAELQSSRLTDERRREREIPMRNAAAEIGAALRLSDRSVQRRMSDAWTLFLRFPATHTALAEGRITQAHVAVIVDAGAEIDDAAVRARFEQAALDRAQIESPGRLRGLIGGIAESVRPVSLTERHRAARAHRGVFVRDVADAMSELTLVAPTVLVHGIHDRLTSMAHEVRHATDAEPGANGDGADGAHGDGASVATDSRTMDQLRADVLTDLALGGAPVAAGDGLDLIRAHVQVTVPVLTLAGVTDGGADLAGRGPVDAETARILAGGATGWDRVMTHPVTGAVLAVDRYRANEDLKRTLRVRDEHCRFPGCRLAVWRCDLDHSHDAAHGGKTTAGNLAHLCRRHHVLKHARGWGIRHLGGGTLEWTTPAGRTYIDIPPSTLRFVASTDPPPF